MKKLPMLLNTPARAVIAVGLIILIVESLIMLLIVSKHNVIIYNEIMDEIVAGIIDPILLIAIVSPVLYILIFRPMRNQQAELENARKKIEQAFQEWIAALDVIDDPVFLHDKEFRILRCNRAYQQCAGIRFREIIGQPYYEIFPKTGAPLPSCLRVMEKTEAAAGEEEMAIGDATYRSRTFSVYGAQGVYLHSVHILEDITERKQAEEKLRETRDYLENLFNHANAPIIVWDSSFRITMFNHAFEHLTGRDANEVIGKQIDTLFPADRKDEALSHIYQTKTGERWETVEIPILHSSGEVRTALWNSATLYSADGKNVVATMAQGQDITERKQAEAQLAEQLEELRGWNDVTLGREMRVLELKHEVDELLVQAGQPPRYPSAESDGQQEK